jgi:hypothetical protein
VERELNEEVFRHLSASQALASGKDTKATLDAPGQETLQTEVRDMETILHAGVSAVSVRATLALDAFDGLGHDVCEGVGLSFPDAPAVAKATLVRLVLGSLNLDADHVCPSAAPAVGVPAGAGSARVGCGGAREGGRVAGCSLGCGTG